MVTNSIWDRQIKATQNPPADVYESNIISLFHKSDWLFYKKRTLQQLVRTHCRLKARLALRHSMFQSWDGTRFSSPDIISLDLFPMQFPLRICHSMLDSLFFSPFLFLFHFLFLFPFLISFSFFFHFFSPIFISSCLSLHIFLFCHWVVLRAFCACIFSS